MPSVCFVGNYAQYSGALQVFRNIAREMKARGWSTGYVYHRERAGEIKPDLSMFNAVEYINDEVPREELAEKMAEFANGFDVVHMSLIPMDWRFLLKLAIKRPIVETYHSIAGWEMCWKQYKLRLGCGIERLADVTTAISSGLSKRIAADLGAPVECIYNGVHIPPAPSSGGRYVTYSGRISHDKGLADWMRVAMAVRDAVPDAKFQWLGELSPGYDNFAFECLKAGCDWLECPGFVEEIGPYYERTAVLLHTSPAEGLPMVIPEAMAYGAAAVAYDVGDTRESKAWIAKDIDDAIRLTVNGLDEDQSTELSRGIRRGMASLRFGITEMADAYESIYKDLIR